MILQADEDDRLAYYKSLIRSEFALKRSIFFCVPTIQDANRAFEALPKGIEDYAFVLNSSLTTAELVKTWNKIVTEPHPVLVIGTGSFFGVPRRDLGTIVVERESSTGYKSRTRPYLDIRTFAEILAKKLEARLIFGDILLRTETLWRTNNGEYAEVSPLKFRSISAASVSIIDMKKYKTADAPGFRIISEEVERLGHKTKESNERMFIFAGRRGLAPLTVCGDCGTSVLCSRCSAPIVLHRLKRSEVRSEVKTETGTFSQSSSERSSEKLADESRIETARTIFLCHRCGERRDAAERCRVCGSWKLTTLGLGLELVEETLRSMFPKTTLFRIDKDATTNHRQAIKTAADFYDAPGSILLGTEMALLYLDRPIENAAIVAIDSLFSIPDFRINEKIMNIILRMRSLTQEQFIIQTRSRGQHVFDYASTGNLMDFYREEIDARQKLDYPPFSTLIKITARGKQKDVIESVRALEVELADYSPITFPAFVEVADGKTVIHTLIRVKPSQWPAEPLLSKLTSLPPQFAVNVDPENLL
jgi:primosomal protein N' (replication factor Y)